MISHFIAVLEKDSVILKKLGLTLAILLCFLFTKGQQKAISVQWEEYHAIQATPFGVPSTWFDNHLYRTFQRPSANGAQVAHLQKIDSNGNIVWGLDLIDSLAMMNSVPTSIEIVNNEIYVIGYTSASGSTTDNDIFVSNIATNGAMDWLAIDTISGEDVPLSFTFNGGNIFYTGSTYRNNNYDMLLGKIQQSNGAIVWSTTYDYNGNIDGGGKVSIVNNDVIINGASQSTNIHWDIVSWKYSQNGQFISEERSSSISTNSCELEDAVFTNSLGVACGVEFANGQKDIKVIAYNSSNSAIWQNSFDSGFGDDEAKCIVTKDGHYYVVGYESSNAAGYDAKILNYDSTGVLSWSNSIDIEGEDDIAVDALLDNDGTLLVLIEAQINSQLDVYLIGLDINNGDLVLSESISTDNISDDHSPTFNCTPEGEIFVNYINGSSLKTKKYLYKKVSDFISDQPLSKSTMYVENKGQVFYSNNEVAEEIKYFSFGQDPSVYVYNEGFSILDWKANNDSLANDSIQRIDFTFEGANETFCGHSESHQRNTVFNEYSKNITATGSRAFSTISYPSVYDNIDAFLSSNKSGFKLAFVLKQGSDIDDIKIDITGALDTAIQGSQFMYSTIVRDLYWSESRSLGYGGEDGSDYCVDYLIEDGYLTLNADCDLQYPYVVEITVGPGGGYQSNVIGNLDWSTFFGGNGWDQGNDISVSNTGDIYAAGLSTSIVFVPDANVTNQTDPLVKKGIALKFSPTTELKWVTFLRGDGLTSNESFEIKELEVYDNGLSQIHSEVHFIGEYTGELSPYQNGLYQIPSSAYLQNNQSNGGGLNQTNKELFYGSLNEFDGKAILFSPFGSSFDETVGDMKIDANGNMYIVGSTKGAGAVGSDQNPNPPSTHDFPIFDPADGSYFNMTNPNGTQTGFLAVINLNDFELKYSSLLNPGTSTMQSYSDVLGLDIASTSQSKLICGEGENHAKFSLINSSTLGPTNQGLTDASSSDYDDIEYFSSASFGGVSGADWILFGYDEIGNTESGNLTATPPYAYFEDSYGPFYIRFREGVKQWSTYFRGNTIVSGPSPWDGHANINGLNESISQGRGKLTYNQSLNALFSLATCQGSVPTAAYTGYFNQSAADATDYGKEDLYINAFSYANQGGQLSIPVSDYFTWGTHFGGNEASGFSYALGREFTGEIVTYSYQGEEYVLTIGTSSSYDGSLTNQTDEFPVADFGTLNGWFQQNNSLSYLLPSQGWRFVDIVISRFKVSDIEDGLPLSSNEEEQKIAQVYPNPARESIRLSASVSAGSRYVILNLGGSVVQKGVLANSEGIIEISQLASGMYVVYLKEINERFKFVKCE